MADEGERSEGGGRLGLFPAAKVEAIRRKLGSAHAGPWPRIEGCLAVLFTARSGSTFLCRELEVLFDIGRMRETLNPAKIEDLAPVRLQERQDKWFSFKAGLQGVIGGELYGVFDAYLPSTSFILLVRRDILAQAVSTEKAAQTGEWHAINASDRRPVYKRGRIAEAIRTIAGNVEQLRRYAQLSGRPWRTLVYEDFASGDFTPAARACDALGVPRRENDSGIKAHPVERVGDEVNDDWIARFQETMEPETLAFIERYQAAL